jgi:TP901 family phage tail tape measure protein
MATAPVTVNANLNFNPASLRAAGNQVQSAFGNINLPSKSINNFNNSLGRITGQASEFDKSINAATARVFAFGAAVSIINGISTAFKGLISSTIEVEKRLTEIGSIIGVSVDQLGRFKTAIFDVAKNTGQTFDTVANGAAELARQGLSAEETVKRLNAALILTRVSGLDAESSVSSLTAAINGFTSAGLTAEQIVNKLIAVDTAFAVSAKDLAEAFSRAGSTAEDAGVSFDELLGLVTAVQQTTARGGAVIGNAFKSIFSRLSRGTVIDDLKALGVEIDQSQTGIQKLQALSTALANISDPTKANAIKELAGGVYQINIVSAALKDLSSETSIFGKASEIAAQASNEAFEKNAQLNQTLAAQINKLVQGLTELGSKVGELTLGPVIQNLLTGANKLLDILNKVFDPEEGNKLVQGFFKGIGAFISGPGLILVSAAFFKLFQVVAKFAAQGVSDLFKIGSEQERIKNIEGGIVALLQQDANLRATLLSTSATQAQKEQAVINSIKQQNTLLTQQQQLVNSIASAAARAGVGGFTPAGGFTNKSGKGKFAAGYMEEEAMARSLGATSSVKAKMGKGTIDGEKFIMNNQEVEIPNFGGGKDSAVIPLYARGFVPNYANRSYTPKQIDKFKPTKDQIDNFRLSDVEKKINDPRFKSFDDDTKAALLAKQQQLKPSKLSIPKALTDQIPFLIPLEGNLGDLGKLRSGTASVLGNDYPYELETGEGQIDYYFPNITPENVDLSDNPYDAQLEDKITENIIDSATAFAKILKPPSKVQGIREKIKDRLTGQSGAAGAIVSAVGAAFEASISAALNIKQAKSRNDADFDVPDSFVEGKETLTRLFGMKEGWKAAEFKATGSRGNINSYIGKIIKFNQLDSKPKKEKTTTTTPKKASGFIPNFAAVNDAISREMEAGVPRDKIYVDQNSSLKSSLNPEGIMVANTIDEPNGGIQGIKRAKKEGQNPKTYGQNFAARGFVPNFFNFTPPAAAAQAAATAPAGSPPAAAAQTAATASLTSATNSATQAIGNLGKTSNTGATNITNQSKATRFSIGNIAGFSLIINSVLPYIQQFAQAIVLDEEALKRETKARSEAVKALEAEKRKGVSANKESITAIEGEITARDASIETIKESADTFATSLSNNLSLVTNSLVSLSILLGPIGKLFAKMGVTGAKGAAGGGVLAKASSVILGAKTLTITGIAAGGAIVIGTAVVAAIATALAGLGIGYLIQKPFVEAADAISRIPVDLQKVRSEIQSLEKIQIPNLEIETNRYTDALYRIEEAFANGYETIKLTATGLRSEFEKINDQSGITGFDAKVQRSQSVDALASGAKDVVTQQNLRRTQDPFEKQRITRDREIVRDSDAQNAGKRERAQAKQIVKAGQEDFLTGISGLFEPKQPSLEEINTKVLQAQADAAGIQGPIDPRKIAKPVLDNVFTSGVDSLDRVDYSGRPDDVNDGTRRGRGVRAGDTYRFAGQDIPQAPELTTRPTARDIGDIGNFVTGLGSALGQKENQTELYDALKRVTDASESLANSTFTTDTSGNIQSNQEDNLQEFLKARDALKPLLERRGEAMVDPNSFMTKKEGEDTPVFDEQGYKAAVEGAAAGLEETFKNYTDTQLEAAKAQTASFIKENAEREQINLNSLQKQKEVLDQFIDNFNASFLQNAQKGADLFAEAMAAGSGTRIQENIAQLQGANLGTGMAGSSDVFAKRQEALIQIMSSLESSGFGNIGTGEQQAAFKSKAAAQILGGGEITAFNDALGAQSANLQKQLSARNSDGTENVLGKQINSDPNARTAIADSTLAFKEILTKLREAAVAATDTNLTADIDKRLATLSDPNATAQQKIAAGNIGLEGTKLDDTTQTEFQKQLINAGGVVQSVIDKLKGVSVATESDALGEQIKGVAEKLTNLQEALKITVDDVTLPTVIKEFTTSTEGLTPIVEAFKTKISELETESSARVELLKRYNAVEEGLLGIQETYQERQKTLLGQATALVTIFEEASKKAKLFADNFPPPPPPASPQPAG